MLKKIKASRSLAEEKTMKHIKYPLLCLFILTCWFPLITTHADFTGEIIYIHPDNDRELWSTSSWDGRDAHRIFTHNDSIEKIAVSKNGSYILMIAYARFHARLDRDLFLIDRTRPRAKARNLTRQRYGAIETMDISHNGDVVFLNSTELEDDPVHGMYLIRREEIEKDLPRAEQRLPGERDWYLSGVRWAPDNERVIYTARGRMYLYNVFKGGIISGIDVGHLPVFSPAGDRLAFAHRLRAMNTAITVISIEPAHMVRRWATVALVDHVSSSHFLWEPDGEALIYTVNGFDRRFHSYRAPLDGGAHEEIFEHLAESPYDFDWSEVSYAVEPTQKLTTLWGTLKAHNAVPK